MAKEAKEKKVVEGLAKYNRVGMPANVIFSIIFIVAALCCIVPVIFVIIISFTDKGSITRNGFSFFPDSWSLLAYESIFKNSKAIFRSFGVSIMVTIVGTAIGVMLNAAMGYVLSRRSFKFHKLYTMLVFIPMVFNGGMVAGYMIVTQVLNLKDTFWSLVLPICVSSFYIIIMRTFFQTTVPDALIESGKIDGASQLRIFLQIVLPISLPALATVGLFLAFTYWNDWFQAMLYVSGTSALWPLQYMLIGIEKSIEFLANNPDMSSMTTTEMLANLPQDGVRMALVVIVVVPIACTYPFFQKYFISGLTIGAVKG